MPRQKQETVKAASGPALGPSALYLPPSRINSMGWVPSELFRYIFIGIIRFFIFVGLLAVGQFHLLAPDFLVGNVAQEMSNDIETHTSLVVGVGNVPWRKMSIGSRKHFIARS